MRPSLGLVNGNFLAVTAQCRLQYPAALYALGALDCAEQLPRFEIKPAAVERSAMAPSRQRVMRRARARTVGGQAGRPRRAAVLPGIGPVPSPAHYWTPARSCADGTSRCSARPTATPCASSLKPTPIRSINSSIGSSAWLPLTWPAPVGPAPGRCDEQPFGGSSTQRSSMTVSSALAVEVGKSRSVKSAGNRRFKCRFNAGRGIISHRNYLCTISYFRRLPLDEIGIHCRRQELVLSARTFSWARAKRSAKCLLRHPCRA